MNRTLPFALILCAACGSPARSSNAPASTADTGASDAASSDEPDSMPAGDGSGSVPDTTTPDDADDGSTVVDAGADVDALDAGYDALEVVDAASDTSEGAIPVEASAACDCAAIAWTQAPQNLQAECAGQGYQNDAAIVACLVETPCALPSALPMAGCQGSPQLSACFAGDVALQQGSTGIFCFPTGYDGGIPYSTDGGVP